MENKKEEYFTEREVIETLMDTLRWFDGSADDLHNEAFNNDYYIIGYYAANHALNVYTDNYVWNAINEVVQWQNNHFGELDDDLFNPESVANMIFYIKGYEFMCEWDIDELIGQDNIDDDNRQLLIDDLKRQLKELEELDNA